jgi:hypothetical protein
MKPTMTGARTLTMRLSDTLVPLFGVAGFLLAGCSGDGSSTAGAGASGTAPLDGPTYYVDAKPIIDAKCASCHTAGGIAPFALETYAQVNAQKGAMLSAINAGTMPPWPASDACNDYLGDRSLSDAQKETLTSWVGAGAIEGDPGAKPAPFDEDEHTLSRTDLTLSMPAPYTPKLSPDEYRCFIVDWPGAETSYVTGFGVQPGTPAMVHHLIAYLATPDKVATFQALDDADPELGYSCFGGPGGGRTAWIGGWAPGALGADFPADTGIEVPPGSKVVLQLHYNTSTTKPVPDQSKVVLKIDKAVARKAVVMPWANPSWLGKGMEIPAHTEDAMHDWEADPTQFIGATSGGVLKNGVPLQVYQAGLHMHTRGTHAITEIHRAGGATECLLDIPKWNFHWQGAYALAAPVTLNPGDKLYLQCHWNNTEAMDVTWGEGTSDEMCLGTYYITQ